MTTNRFIQCLKNGMIDLLRSAYGSDNPYVQTHAIVVQIMAWFAVMVVAAVVVAQLVHIPIQAVIVIVGIGFALVISERAIESASTTWANDNIR